MNKKIYFILCIALSSVLTEWLLYSQNNLVQNNQWLVTKKLNQMGITGGDDFLLSRSVLHKNVLDLSKYYGFQEIYSKRVWNIRNVEFEFSALESGFLLLKVFKYAKPIWGIKFNTHPDKESFIFRYGENQEFLDVIQLKLKKLNQEINKVSISINKANLIINVNGEEKSFELSKEFITKGQIGFQGAYRGTFLDNVIIQDQDYTIFEEDFRRSNNWWMYFLIHLFIIISFFEILHYVIKLKWKNVNFRLIFVSQLLFFLFSFLLFDYYYWSKFQFFNQTKLLFSYKNITNNSIEKLRFNIFESWADLFVMNEDVQQLYRDNMYSVKKIWKGPILCSSFQENCFKVNYPLGQDIYNSFNECLKILLLGTSQSMGSGASNLNKTFYAKFFYKIKDKMKDTCFILLNNSISGEKMRNVWKNHLNNYEAFNPNIVLLNMGNNDNEDELAKFVPIVSKYTREKNIDVWLNLEPNVPESDEEGYNDKLQNLSKLGLEYGFYVTDARANLLEVNTNDGNLWWDRVHLSNFGHEVFSNFLENKFLEK